METILIIFIVIAILAFNGKPSKHIKIDNTFREPPKNEAGQEPTHYLFYLSTSSKLEPKGIAVYHELKKVCFLSGNYKTASIDKKYIDYKDITGVELIQDGEIITSTSRGNQLLGIAAGGVLLGGAGAVIGGLSSKKVSKKKITVIAISIKINDVSNPSIYFTIKSDSIQISLPGNSKKTVSEEEVLDTAKKWYDIFKAIISQTEKESKAKGNENNKESNSSIVEKISTLTELHKSGALTDEEFSNAKKIIICQD